MRACASATGELLKAEGAGPCAGSLCSTHPSSGRPSRNLREKIGESTRASDDRSSPGDPAPTPSRGRCRIAAGLLGGAGLAGPRSPLEVDAHDAVSLVPPGALQRPADP